MGLQIFLLCTKQIYSWKILYKVKTRISNLNSLPTSILVEKGVLWREKGTDAGWMSVCQALCLAHRYFPPSPWERGFFYFVLKMRNGLREVYIYNLPKVEQEVTGKNWAKTEKQGLSIPWGSAPWAAPRRCCGEGEGGKHGPPGCSCAPALMWVLWVLWGGRARGPASLAR